MLNELTIAHYALIDQLHIRLHEGFSVITGETGAGKSILLGAIGLLLGQRADSKAIRTGEKRCVIEAVFDVEDYGLESFFETNDLDFDGKECLVRLEVNASGKSRAFVNDTPVPLTVLKALGEKLIDIHSQHQNLLLGQEDFQLNVLDALANNEKERKDYRQTFDRYQHAKRELKQLEEEAQAAREDEDFLTYQLKQLEEAALQAGEDEALEQEGEMLSHAEEIKEALFGADQLLSGEETGTLNTLRDALRRLQSIADVNPQAAELAERAESAYIELKDLASEAANLAERTEFNPARLEQVNERLNLIYALQQKHRVDSVDDLLQRTREFQEKLDAAQHSDERLEACRKTCDRCRNELLAHAEKLTRGREEVARLVEEQLREKLIPLGIPHARFSVTLTPRTEPDATGMDKTDFLFCANKNGEMQRIADVASGGEIARVMLALKALTQGGGKRPTLVFDEIDTGVSGHIAEKMGHIMHEMGCGGQQVISITHLPQIAALGAAHYKVYKEDNEAGTVSHIVELMPEERVEEIAHMLSGATLTDAARNNAKALLHTAKNNTL